MQRSRAWRIFTRCVISGHEARRLQSHPFGSSHIKYYTLRTELSRHQSTRISHQQDAVDTIFALSTPPGRSAIAVIRLSGPACLDIYRALCPGKADPLPRYATVRKLYAPRQPASADTILDANALVLFFPAPKTVTGEAVLELHVHGGSATVQAVLRAIPLCAGNATTIRFAEPGEFTRRAFWNDKLDLTQVEALGDVLAATTEQQRRLSVRGTSGSLSKVYDQWRKQLLYARGELEALIDFSEDQHFDESTAELLTSVATQVRSLETVLQTHIQNAVRGELLRSGISISLLGAPNAGKSSLLNRIVGREAAIVSQEAGTTRDVVEVGVDLGGYFCRFGDTAGLRGIDVAGDIEREGMKRALNRAEASDVVVIVLSFEEATDGPRLLLDPEVVKIADRLAKEDNHKVIVAINKIDTVEDKAALEQATAAVQRALPEVDTSRILPISCLPSGPGDSVQVFLAGLCAHFDNMTAALSSDGIAGDQSSWQDSLGASERHRLLLESCLASLQDFLAIADSNEGEDADIVVAAEHLRTAAECLAKITGRGEAGDVEEVLGVVFEKFCVGK